MTVLGTVHTVLRGTAQPLSHLDGRPGGLSAIAKSAVAGAVHAGPLGLEGDMQADLRVHGGPDKALHQYPYEHYAAWQSELGDLAALDQCGAFGENLSSIGMTEQTLCLGDVVRLGSVTLVLTQTRQPCWKLNSRFGRADMARRVQTTGRTGWYWKVQESGSLQAGDAMFLLERPYPEWPLTRVLQALYQRCLERDELQALAALPLPPSWQKMLAARLERGQVEDWSRRIDG